MTLLTWTELHAAAVRVIPDRTASKPTVDDFDPVPGSEGPAGEWRYDPPGLGHEGGIQHRGTQWTWNPAPPDACVIVGIALFEPDTRLPLLLLGGIGPTPIQAGESLYINYSAPTEQGGPPWPLTTP